MGWCFSLTVQNTLNKAHASVIKRASHGSGGGGGGGGEWRPPVTNPCVIVRKISIFMSRILSMHFRSFTTRGHSLTTLTLALHELLHTITKYNSHHPLALTSHSWLHWSRSHLRTLTQSLSPNHTRFISLGLPLALCRVLYCVYHSHSDSYLTEPSQ